MSERKAPDYFFLRFPRDFRKRSRSETGKSLLDLSSSLFPSLRAPRIDPGCTTENSRLGLWNEAGSVADPPPAYYFPLFPSECCPFLPTPFSTPPAPSLCTLSCPPAPAPRPTPSCNPPVFLPVASPAPLPSLAPPRFFIQPAFPDPRPAPSLSLGSSPLMLVPLFPSPLACCPRSALRFRSSRGLP